MTAVSPRSRQTALPRDSYLSDSIYEQELDRIFFRQWLYAGHVSQVGRSGEFFEARVGGESLIIVRDQSGVIRAFFNVCRHRGSRLCEAGAAGESRRLTCSYHQWSYRLDGRLQSAPGSPDGQDFDYSDLSLHEAVCDVHFGAIYVWLGDESPPPLADVLTAAASDPESVRSVAGALKLAYEKRYAVRANWKLLLENNMECYHCAGSHPSLAVACDFRAYFTQPDGSPSDPDAGHFPIRAGMKTFSMDGDWVCRRQLGDGNDPRFSAGYLLVPAFSGTVFFADHAVAMALSPEGPHATELTCQWLVHEEAVEGVDYELESLVDVFDVTNLEDIALTEATQGGIRSRRYVPGPLAPTREPGVGDALAAYRSLMVQ